MVWLSKRNDYLMMFIHKFSILIRENAHGLVTPAVKVKTSIARQTTRESSKNRAADRSMNDNLLPTQIDYLYFILITLFFMGHEAEGIKARPNVVVHYFPVDVLAMSITQTYNKVLLTIVLCATSAWCGDGTSELIRNARTIGPLSFFAWPKALFRNQLNLSIFPKIWPSRPQLWEWTRSGAARLLRFASFASTGKGPIHIEFRPEEPHAAEMYQRRFGYRGEWLIEQLGNGLGPNIRLYRQPIPSTFLTPPLSHFRNSSNFY